VHIGSEEKVNKEPERRCPRCNGELIETTHRSEGGEKRDPRGGTRRGEQKLCFNGKVKAEHICVAECRKSGLMCLNCHNLIDTSEERIT
jgi:hypothetical protein